MRKYYELICRDLKNSRQFWNKTWNFHAKNARSQYFSWLKISKCKNKIFRRKDNAKHIQKINKKWKIS